MSNQNLIARAEKLAQTSPLVSHLLTEYRNGQLSDDAFASMLSDYERVARQMAAKVAAAAWSPRFEGISIKRQARGNRVDATFSIPVPGQDRELTRFSIPVGFGPKQKSPIEDAPTNYVRWQGLEAVVATVRQLLDDDTFADAVKGALARELEETAKQAAAALEAAQQLTSDDE